MPIMGPRADLRAAGPSWGLQQAPEWFQSAQVWDCGVRLLRSPSAVLPSDSALQSRHGISLVSDALGTEVGR